jgi:uncharacterized protein (TIGR02246 family)
MVRDEIMTLAQQFGKAVANQDVDELVGFYTEDARMLPPNAPMIQGRDGLRAIFREYFDAGMKSLELETVDVLEDGQLAVEVGRYVMGIQPLAGDPVEDRGKYIAVYRRQPDGALKIAADTFNSDHPAPSG